MSTNILSTTSFGKLNTDFDPSGLKKTLGKSGRFPPIELVINPLGAKKRISLNRFTSYSFNSSIMVPVDTFNFNFVAPDDKRPTNSIIRSADIVTLHGNQIPLATGIIDVVELQVDRNGGELATINGRDLMSQLEDNDAVSFTDDPVWGNAMTIQQVLNTLCTNTRIQSAQAIFQNAPTKPYLFATEPGETKLTALQRFMEPLNILAWMSPGGRITVGRPNMKQAISGRLVLSKTKRASNVLSMKATRATTKIPNVVVPIWAGQETTQSRVPKSQRILNNFKDPSRIRSAGHVVAKSVVSSTPQGAGAQDLSEVNKLTVAGGSLLQALAKSMIAKANVEDLIVQAVVPGHYNEAGRPFQTDTLYKVEFDRGDVDEVMYLYQVEMRGSEEEGQLTVLTLCRLGTIVSDILAP